jgi:hypothetical protein
MSLKNTTETLSVIEEHLEVGILNMEKNTPPETGPPLARSGSSMSPMFFSTESPQMLRCVLVPSPPNATPLCCQP